ncbi:MAG: endolytic transglycosylase MltG [bacterium]
MVVALIASFLLYFLGQLFIPLSVKNKLVEVEIPKGVSYRKAFDILKEYGLVRDRYVMIFLGRLTGLDRKIKAGYYSFWDKEMPVTVLKTLLEGKIIEYTVTIIEGDTVWDVAEKLEQANIMDQGEFFRLYRNRDFLDSLNIEAPSLEGYLFPDTYKLPKGVPPEEALRVMVNTLRAHFTAEMYERMFELRFAEKEILTLASIIEKEAVVDFERPVISAVYHNRLKKKMRLQADPTSIYGIKDYKTGVTRSDLRRRTPYNTYIKRGLPPGPIAAPGFSSIMAALYPANVPFLYFVSKDNREHYFSRNMEEHANAVKHYKSIRSTQGKSEQNAEQ